MKKFNTDFEAVKKELVESMATDDAERQEKAFNDFVDCMQADITQKAMAMKEAKEDERVLEARGILTPLTAEEREYFNAVVERKGFDGVEKTFPKTIINDVLEKIKNEHPLL